MKANFSSFFFCFFLLFSLFHSKLYSQDYDSLAIEGAHWIIQGDDGTTPWLDTCYGYKIEGDTIVNLLNYKKVYRLFFHADYSSGAPVWNWPLLIEGKELFALVRDENRKVFAIKYYQTYFGYNCVLNEEFLLFDFNFQIGDTICDLEICNLCVMYEYFQIVTDITPSGYYAGHKEFRTSDHYLWEGIGFEMGLFETTGTPLSGGVIPGLLDYCIGTDANCGLLTNNSLIISNKSSVNISYILNNIIKIDLFGIKLPASIEISSMSGQILKVQNNIISESIELNINNLKSGIYLLRIANDDKVITKKIVIN